MLYCKKLVYSLLSLVLVATSSQLFCWKHTFTNKTGFPVEVTVDIVAGTDKKETLNAEEKKDIEVGLHCVRGVKAFAPQVTLRPVPVNNPQQLRNNPQITYIIKNVSTDYYPIKGQCGIVYRGQSKDRNYAIYFGTQRPEQSKQAKETKKLQKKENEKKELKLPPKNPKQQAPLLQPRAQPAFELYIIEEAKK